MSPNNRRSQSYSLRGSSFVAAILATTLSYGASADDIRIVVAGPVTGPLAAPGAENVSGAKQAVADINANGGVNGDRLVLSIEDDACDPKQAVSVANKIVADGIKLVAGHFCSGSTIPASEVYNELGVTEITVSSNPTVTERGFKHLFRFSGRDDQQGPAGAAFVLKRFAGKRIGLLSDRSAYGNGLVVGAKQYLSTQGASVAFDDGINAGEKDYRAVAAKLKNEKIDVIYFGGYHTEAALLARQAQEAGYELSIVGGDGLNTPELASIAGPAAKNVFFTFPPDASKTPEGARLAARMQQQGASAGGWAIYYYGIVQTLAEGVRRARSQDADLVTKAIRSAPVDTVVGPISFDAKGDNAAPGYVIYGFSEGKPVEINAN
jgi:branched-chain amino acid transport system substrate-binding protein